MSTAYLFPGQGSQVVSMGRASATRSRRAAELFDAASAALGRDMRRLCWESSLEELTRTENLQPALTLAALADWVADEHFERREGDAYSGHSVGALGAAVAAGAIDPVDGIRLAAARGRLMASAPAGGSMVAVVTPRSQPGEQQRHAEELAVATALTWRRTTGRPRWSWPAAARRWPAWSAATGSGAARSRCPTRSTPGSWPRSRTHGQGAWTRWRSLPAPAMSAVAPAPSPATPRTSGLTCARR